MSKLRRFVAFVFAISGITFCIREIFQRGKVIIVIYHDPEPDVFKKHMAYLSKVYNFVPLSDLVAAIQSRDWSGVPKKGLVVTFDDGIKQTYELLSLFRKYKVIPTIYLCSHIVGTYRKFWFRAGLENYSRLKQVENSQRLEALKEAIDYEPDKEYSDRQALNWEEIREMSPDVDFQSHSQSHPILINCSDEECREEIEGSKAQLERDLNKSVEHFCYPNGDYSAREVNFVKNAGYTSARSVDIGWNSVNSDPYRLKAMYVDDDATINVLKVQAAGILGYIRHLRKGRFDGTHPPYV